jgi:hypothetical protein
VFLGWEQPFPENLLLRLKLIFIEGLGPPYALSVFPGTVAQSVITHIEKMKQPKEPNHSSPKWTFVAQFEDGVVTRPDRPILLE